MVKVQCSVPNCGFETPDASEALAIVLLANHGLAHQNPTLPAPAPPPAPHGPSLDRPKVNIGVTTEDCNVFVRRWEVFRTGSRIDDAAAPSQLFQCAGPELGDSLLKTNPHAAAGTLPQLLEAMRSLAVIPVATGVLRTELLQLRQERDEPFRAFSAWVRGKAETCAFRTKCECGQDADYTDHAIRDVLLNGIADPDIRREALGTLDILTTPVNDVVALVENKEWPATPHLPQTSQLSQPSNANSASHQQTPPHAPPPADRSRQAVCPDCRTLFLVFKEGVRGWNKKPHQVCINCYRTRRQKRRQNQAPDDQTSSVQATESISQVAAAAETSVGPSPLPRRRRRRRHTKPTHGPVTLDHHVFTKGEWKKARLRPHPHIKVTVSVDTPPQAKHAGS